MRNYINMIMSILLVLLIVSLSACQFESESDLYCKHIESLAKNSAIATQLKSWVAENISEKQIFLDEALPGGGMWPGFYWLPIQFDWQMLGFEQLPQIRLVGTSVDDELDGKLDSIKSVFFGERSRYGILVRLQDADGFGVEEDYLIPISSEIAIVCKEGD